MSCGTIFTGETWKGPESSTRMASQKRRCLKSVLKHRRVKCMWDGVGDQPDPTNSSLHQGFQHKRSPLLTILLSYNMSHAEHFWSFLEVLNPKLTGGHILLTLFLFPLRHLGEGDPQRAQSNTCAVVSTCSTRKPIQQQVRTSVKESHSLQCRKEVTPKGYTDIFREWSFDGKDPLYAPVVLTFAPHPATPHLKTMVSGATLEGMGQWEWESLGWTHFLACIDLSTTDPVWQMPQADAAMPFPSEWTLAP